MATVIAQTRAGAWRTIDSAGTSSLMEALREGGVDDIAAICGGACACATCHVYIADAWLAKLPPMSDDENELLDGSMNRRESSRLSCQIPRTAALAGLRLSIAPED